MEYLEQVGKFIEQQVEHHGVVKVLAAPFVLLASLSVFGLRVEDGSRVLLTVLLLVVSMVLITALSLRARSSRSRLNTLIPIANDYAELLQKGTAGDDFTIGKWTENVEIGKNGDAKIHRSVEIRNGNHPRHFAWSASTSYNEEFGPKARGRVRTEVRTSADEGSDGTRTGLTYKWQERTQTLFAHFGTPLDAGQVIHLNFYWTWPRYSTFIENGVPENFQWRVKRDVESISSVIRFLPASKAKADFLNAQRIGNSGEMAPLKVSTDGSIEIQFDVKSPPKDVWVGVRVDKKKTDAR